MKCTDYQKLISDRLDGSLSLRLQKKLEAHLKVCQACRLYEDELRTLHEEISLLPAAEPENPAALEAGLRERLVQVKTEKKFNRGRNQFVRWAPAWAGGLLLIAAGLYLVLFLRTGKDQAVDLAALMSFEESYLTLSQALSNDDNWKDRYNEEILNSIYEEVRAVNFQETENNEVYEQNIINKDSPNNLLSENMGSPEGI